MKEDKPKDHILYAFFYMLYPEQANPKKQRADQKLPGGKRWRWEWGVILFNDSGVFLWGDKKRFETEVSIAL